MINENGILLFEVQSESWGKKVGLVALSGGLLQCECQIDTDELVILKPEYLPSQWAHLSARIYGK